MKKMSFSIKSVLIMIALFSAILTTGAPAFSAEQVKERKSITVQGSSSVTAAPTIAYVSIGVTTFNKNAATAQSENAVKMDRVYKTLASLGIKKDKIKTVNYNISPRYDYKNNVATLAGYNVINSIRVTVMDLKKVSDVLDMTVKEGVNQSNSISFGVTDEERNRLYLQALSQAVVNAKEKANTIATAAGITISKPANIIEGSSAHFVQPNYRAMDMAKMASEAAPTPISEGEMTIGANVTVIYDY
ncbi:MAG: SIMPL domain-containing protein [Sulfuricurvum sp.]|uniref:SIMPL domain-containing protein n=1 Tax=Sulfuricurvum sp. TaxID=2025608 RepID=UPI003D112DF1